MTTPTTITRPLLLSLVLFASSCTGGSDSDFSPDASDEQAASDAAPAKLADAAVAPPAPDAAILETCTADWCSLTDAPSYGYGLAVTPAGQPWIVGYGAHARTGNSWIHHEPTWSDFVSPFVVHNLLYTVHAFSSTDVWVSGEQGYLGHFNGSTWTEHRPIAPSAKGIWGAAANDLWFLYDTGVRYHWNGTNLVASGNSEVDFSGAWGASSSDVWGYGNMPGSSGGPALDHWDGINWQSSILPGTGRIISFWASGPQDLWAVRYGAVDDVLLHGDGSTWMEVDLPANQGVLAVWGRSADDIWVVGRAGKIFHFNGTTWSNSPSGTTVTLDEITGNDTNIWITGQEVALHSN